MFNVHSQALRCSRKTLYDGLLARSASGGGVAALSDDRNGEADKGFGTSRTARDAGGRVAARVVAGLARLFERRTGGAGELCITCERASARVVVRLARLVERRNSRRTRRLGRALRTACDRASARVVARFARIVERRNSCCT